MRQQSPRVVAFRDPVRCGQLSPPRIVHDYGCTEFGSLYNSLNFSTIPHPLPSTLCEKKINGTFLIAIAAFKEGIAIKKELSSIFGGSTLEEIFSNGLGDEHTRKEEAELRQEIEMIQGNDAGTVDGAAGCPHSNYFRSAGAKISKPKASVPKASSAFCAFCSALTVLRYHTMSISA